jgi:hypothetical protein
VRIPAIAIGLAGNLLVCIAMGRWFGRTAAFVTAFAICFDPTVGMQSRLDWGPNAIMFLCRGGFLVSMALATTGRVRSGLLGMAAFTAAGCFDKLSFLWVVVPGLAMFMVIERELLLGLLRRHRAATIGWCLTMAAVVGGALLLAIVAPLQPPSTSLAVRVAEAGQLLWSAMAGDGAISVVYWGAAGQHGMQAALALGSLVLAAALGLRAVRPQVSAWKRAWMWLCSSCALVALMFTVTRDATGPHHAAVIGGLWQLPFVPPIAAGIARLGWRGHAFAPAVRGAGSAAIQCILVATASVACLTMTWQRVSALVAPPVNPNWDTANWRLAEFIASSTDQTVVMTDWGMGNQAIAVTRGRSGRVADAWPSFSSDRGAAEALDRHGMASLYCLRTPSFETMRGHRKRFLATAATRGLAPLRVAAFANEQGAEMIEVVRLVPLNRPSAGVR